MPVPRRPDHSEVVHMTNRMLIPILILLVAFGGAGLHQPRGEDLFRPPAGAETELSPTPVMFDMDSRRLPTDLIDNSGRTPQDVVTADFNRDGIPDLAIAFAFDDAVRIYFGAGDGTFVYQGAKPVGIDATLLDLPRKLLALDFDHDGFLDLAVLCSGNPSVFQYVQPSLGILYGTPLGDFEPFRSIAITSASTPEPQFALILEAGPINGDEWPDFVVGHFDSGQVSIVLSSGHRRWEPATVLPVTRDGAGPAALAIVDLNQDGASDLVLGNRRDLQVWHGNGLGDFNLRRSFTSGTAFTAIAPADFDRDGAWDLAALDGAEQILHVFMGLRLDGTSQQSFAIPLTGGIGPVDLVQYDANLDGRDDLAIIYLQSGGGDLYLGQSGPSRPPLTFRRHFLTADAPRALIAADFNMDGRPDLAVIHEADQTNVNNADLVLDISMMSLSPGGYLSGGNAFSPGQQTGPFLDRPGGLGWDAGHQALWTIDRRARTLVELAPNGSVVNAYPLARYGAVFFADPVDIAADSSGTLWIADRLANRLRRIRPEAMVNSQLLDLPTTRPAGVAIDLSTSRVFVSDESRPAILAYSMAGQLLREYEIAGGHAAGDLAWDDSTSTLLAILPDPRGRLVRLRLNEATGQAAILAAALPEDLAPVLSRSRLQSVAVNRTGERLWLLGKSGILVRAERRPGPGDATADFPTAYSVQDILETTLLREIRAVESEPGGTLLLADSGPLGTLVRLDSAGNVINTITLNAFDSLPLSIEGISRRGNRLFVLDGFREEIRQYDDGGTYLGTVGSAALIRRRPRGLLALSGGSGYLVGSGGNLLELNAAGLLVATHPVPASAPPGSLSGSEGGGRIVYFSPVREALFYLGQNYGLRNVIAQKRQFPRRFQPRAVSQLEGQSMGFVIVGSGSPNVLMVESMGSSSRADAKWMRYP